MPLFTKVRNAVAMPKGVVARGRKHSAIGAAGGELLPLPLVSPAS